MLETLLRFVIFACQYGFSKCMRTALCALAVMLPLILWRCLEDRRGNGSADLRFYRWFLLFPAAMMGMSKLFFQRWSIWLHSLTIAFGEAWVACACFAVMAALAVLWMTRRAALSRKVRGMHCWRTPGKQVRRSEESWRDCLERVTAGSMSAEGRTLAGRYLDRARVYIGENENSPFCGGVLHPYIVMPELYLEPADGEGQGYEDRRLTRQGEVLLCHELLHLKYGHILWLNLFALLRIYWWFDPLIYLCEKWMRQDMEQACDEGCLYYTGVSEREYGRLLLAVAAGQTPVRLAGAATFLRDRDYRCLKSRIGNLRGKCERAQYRRTHRRMGLGCALTLVLAAVAVGCTSYPRYTRLTELTLYDEQLHLICNDSPGLREAVQVVDGYLQIDPERMDACLGELEVEGSHVYLGYDTIMKVPGVGGGGNVGMIALADYSDIFYLRAETWENDWMEFMLKYLL